MRSGWGMILSISLLLVLVDGVTWLYLKDRLKLRIFKIFYWVLTLLFILGTIAYHFLIRNVSGPEIYRIMSIATGILMTCYLPKGAAVILRTLCIPFTFLGNRARKLTNRTVFAVFLALAVTCIYSFTIGRTAFRMRETAIPFSSIPEDLRGLKIVHLSDLHVGSLPKNFKGVEKLVNKVNATDPDLIVCTGDFVNNFSSEMLPFVSQFSKLKARYGVYGILGNHDYGLYSKWDSPDLRAADHRKLIENIEAAGFRLLINSNVKIKIGRDTLCLAGVENWGNPPFPRYGDLEKALENSGNYFTVVLTHDPTHWKAEVLGTHADLTLAGHTHAMQMGISIGPVKWSPSKYLYEEYDGLYRSDNEKYINVSRGQGYIGIPGRLGMRPAIDIITLTKKTD